MSGCCIPVPKNSNAAAALTPHCPECGAKGKKVDTQTVKAMVALSLDHLHATAYRFCQTEACPVVYFATDNDEVYLEEDVRVPVHQKAPHDEEVPVCYCFQHTPGSIQLEWLATGASTAVEK